jgi:toxin-antitoxin system PIN domain toxin
MRFLLDINVLIALLDRDHNLHQLATGWFSFQGKAGWASCPLTQNGCIRIMSHPNYPNFVTVQAIRERLVEACADPHHNFWPDDISLLDEGILEPDRIHGPKQLTDLYLLALAVHHGGRFVTFDSSIPLDAVKGIGKHSLVSL